MTRPPPHRRTSLLLATAVLSAGALCACAAPVGPEDACAEIVAEDSAALTIDRGRDIKAIEEWQPVVGGPQPEPYVPPPGFKWVLAPDEHTQCLVATSAQDEPDAPSARALPGALPDADDVDSSDSMNGPALDGEAAADRAAEDGGVEGDVGMADIEVEVAP